MFRYSIAFLICVFSVLAFAIELSDVGAPPDSQASFVGSVVQNGIPMEMMEFKAASSPLEVIAFYKIKWSDNTDNAVPDFIEKEVGEWRVLTKVQNNFSVVVQVKDSVENGAEGFVSIANLKKPKKINRLSKDFPRLGGTEFVSSTESFDGGKNATTLIMMNKLSIDSNDAFYRSKMSSDGWRLVSGDLAEGVATMLFNRSGQQCELAIGKGDRNRTVIIVNIVEAQ